MSTGAQDEGAAVDVPDPRTDLPALPTTGDDQVDATLRALRQELERGDPGAAADALAAAHRSLQARLTSPEVDEPGSPGARPRPR